MSREEIFQNLIAGPHLLSQVFLHLLPLSKGSPLFDILDIEHESHLSFLFDASGIQDSFSFRALHRARMISLSLIDDRGEVKKDFLEKIIHHFEGGGYFFYPQGYNDRLITEHVLHFLRTLNDPKIIKSLKRFQNPLCSKWAEKLIFQTLNISSMAAPTDAQIKMAVLCACMTPLRQNVGSCFATAPAILIQSDQVFLFLDDLYQLLSTGKLKRTFGGVEYAIPMSPSTGIGDIKKKLTVDDGNIKPHYCPGVIAALETAGILPPHSPFETQVKIVKTVIDKFRSQNAPLSVGDLIRFVLLERFSLKKEELENARSLEAAQIKNLKSMHGMQRPQASSKLEQISGFKEKEKECRASFKAVCDNALLKTWEFTLASFSEVKMEFSRWNLYSSLGFASNEPGGIGEVLYQKIDEKINAINAQLQMSQTEYELSFDQVRTAEALLRNASSDSEARRLQAEYQSRAYHMRSCLEARDAIHSKGSNYSSLYGFLIKQYDQKFPEYFQEIYDAEMQDLQQGRYDDSPAGFRLVYKHGRTDPSLWTLIDDSGQYIDALLDFFSITESQIKVECSWEGGAEDIVELTSVVLAHIKTNIFLESALQRMARAHQSLAPGVAMSNLQRLEKKPWAYTSGGTMTTLLKTYYCRESEFAQEEKWVESESELLIFILDTMKNLSFRITEQCSKMLMASPTHAFVLLPTEERFKQGWQEDIFTYTWVRDEVFLPSQRFYSEMVFGYAEQAFLLEKFKQQLPESFGHWVDSVSFRKDKKLTVIQWRNLVLDAFFKLSKPPQALKKQFFSDKLDVFLYQNLPIVQGKQYKAIVRRILSDLMNESVEQILNQLPDNPSLFLTAHELKNAAKGCLLLANKRLESPFDIHEFVAKHARFVGAAQPTALLFADTNWVDNYFGFVVNPGNGRLELWRLDRTMSYGTPMSDWKQWVDGSERKTWTILTHPHQYSI